MKTNEGGIAIGHHKKMEIKEDGIVRLEWKTRKVSIESARAIIQLAKVANLLFPKNIAIPIRAAEENGKAVMYFKEVENKDRDHAIITSIRNKYDGNYDTGGTLLSTDDNTKLSALAYNARSHSREYVRIGHMFAEAGLHLYETEYFNFIKDVEGNYVYVDFDEVYTQDRLLFDPLKLSKFIDATESEIVKIQAKKEFDSLMDLLPDKFKYRT